MTTATPPCPWASRLSPQMSWILLNLFKDAVSTTTTNWIKKTSLLSKTCWWVLNQSKAPLVEEHEEKQQSKVSRATHRCCLLWTSRITLLQMVISKFQKNSSFFYKAPPSAHQALNRGVRYPNLAGSYLCTSGRSCRKGGTWVWSLHILGAGSFLATLDEAWRLMVLKSHTQPDENYLYNIKVLFPSSIKSHTHENIFQLPAQLFTTYSLFAVLPHFQSIQKSPYRPQYTGNRELKEKKKNIIKSISCL